MIDLHNYGTYEVHTALNLARYLKEAGAETPEEHAVCALAEELQRARDRAEGVHAGTGHILFEVRP